MGIIRGLAAQPTDRLIGTNWEMRRTAKATTRPDGSALVVGDRLILVADGTQWFWNGTYWLSAGPRLTATVTSAPSSSWTVSSSSYPWNINHGNHNIFVLGTRLQQAVMNAPQDATNNWLWDVRIDGSSLSAASIRSNEVPNGTTASFDFFKPVNQHVVISGTTNFSEVFVSTTGTPGGTRRGSFILEYRQALK